MADWDTTIIPLDDAHEVLSVFGIGPSSREYQRWRRDDGIRHVDFEGVLSQSGSVLTIDWREWLQDAAHRHQDRQRSRVSPRPIASPDLAHDDAEANGQFRTPVGRVQARLNGQGKNLKRRRCRKRKQPRSLMFCDPMDLRKTW
jgi:hypothetical protein